MAYLFYGFIMINTVSLSFCVIVSFHSLKSQRKECLLLLGPAVFSRLIAKTLRGFPLLQCGYALRQARSRTQAADVMDQVMGQNGGREGWKERQ